MKYILVIAVMVVLALFSGCMSTPPSSNTTSGTMAPATTTPGTQPPGPVLIIHASPEKYTLGMSSTVGIGLIPEYPGPDAVTYRWETNYGHFLSWNQTDGKITEYNWTAVTPGMVYWSFLNDEVTGAKPPVTISVSAIRMTSGTPAANTTVYIGWEDDTKAVVVPEPCGVTNCHGPEIICGSNIAEICTALYQIGGKCRGLATCRIRNGTCTMVPGPDYASCASCAENCERTSGGDPTKAFDCESRC